MASKEEVHATGLVLDALDLLDGDLRSGFRVPLRGPGMTAGKEPLQGNGKMSGWVYIMASRRNGTIYTGVTSDLQGRAYEHRTSAQPGFTSRYGCNRLVWYERHDNIIDAIAREKELKTWRRSWKLYLIEGFNAEWDDLFETCYERDNPCDAIRTRTDAVRRLD